MTAHTCISKSMEKTRKLGISLAKKLNGGDVVLLDGNLGTGKTHFVQGVAKELGIKKHITSPTFAIMNIYPVPPAVKNKKQNIHHLAHIDLYRVKTLNEALAVGIMDYIGEPSTLTLIEWPEKIQNAIPKDRARIIVTFKHQGNTTRSITIKKIT